MNTPFFFEEIVLLSLLAGILAIDDKAGWQSLLSQPLFAGVVVGMLLGEVTTALKVGLVLELVWLSVMPMRATRRPDAVAGAVVGVLVGVGSGVLQPARALIIMLKMMQRETNEASHRWLDPNERW